MRTRARGFDSNDCAMKFQVDPEVFTNPREVV